MDIFIVKDNLVDSLCSSLIPHILDGFVSIYEDAIRVNNKKPQEQYKRFLLDIKSWPPKIVMTETKRILSLFKTLRKVLKTINYINIKSLALIGRHNIQVDDDYISKHTPSVDTFVHLVYMNSAKEFFHDDTLMNYSVPGTRLRQSTIVESVIKQLLHQFVPISELLHNINNDTDVTLLDVSKEQNDTEFAGDTNEDTKNNTVITNTTDRSVQKKKESSFIQEKQNQDQHDEDQDQELEQDQDEDEDDDVFDETDEQPEQDEQTTTVLTEEDEDNDESIIIPVKTNNTKQETSVQEDSLDLLENISNSLFTDAKMKYLESETNENGIGALVDKMPDLNIFSSPKNKNKPNVTVVTPTLSSTKPSRPMISLRNKGQKK